MTDSPDDEEQGDIFGGIGNFLGKNGGMLLLLLGGFMAMTGGLSLPMMAMLAIGGMIIAASRAEGPGANEVDDPYAEEYSSARDRDRGRDRDGIDLGEDRDRDRGGIDLNEDRGSIDLALAREDINLRDSDINLSEDRQSRYEPSTSRGNIDLSSSDIRLNDNGNDTVEPCNTPSCRDDHPCIQRN